MKYAYKEMPESLKGTYAEASQAWGFSWKEFVATVPSPLLLVTTYKQNGQIAVDMFASHPEKYYDAVLMDVRMPVMDGLEAARTLRALNRPDAKIVPIIALTANAFDEDVQRSLQAGMNAHLSKPVEPDRLYDTLRRLTCAAE